MSCSSDDQSEKECPLCMEQLEIDDVDFYPCKCEYQICRFCWHRLRTDENGLCPACRQPYPEDPVNFKPISSADLLRIKDEKKMKQQAERLRISESRKHLTNYRVLQKNLVYVVGLSQRVATEEMLRKPEYFGRFGKILKVVTGVTPATNLPHIQPSHTAYVTFSKIEEALRAIQGVTNAQLDGRLVKASLGTTKYCSSYLRTQTCGKPECMYLHDIADDDISFTKEDMHLGKHTDYEKRLIESMLNRRDQERRQPGWNKTACWEQNGRQISEEPTTNGGCSISDESEIAVDIDDPTPSEALALEKERLISQDKENQGQKQSKSARQKSKQTTSQQNRSPVPVPDEPREPTPPPIDIVPELEPVEEEVQIQTAPPPPPAPQQVPTPPSLFTSMADTTEASLMRLLTSSPDAGRGSVPAPATREEAPAPLMNWQSLLGLTAQPEMSLPLLTQPSRPKRIQSPPGLSSLLSDDDLGFDPYNESRKGLEELVEEEERFKKHTYPYFQSVASAAPSFGSSSHGQSSLRDLWSRPSAAPSNGHQMPHQTQTSSHNMNSFDMFGMSSQVSSGFSNGLNLPSYSSDHYGHHQQQHQPPHAAPAPSHPHSSHSSAQTRTPAHLHLLQQQQQAQQQHVLQNSIFASALPPGLSAPVRHQSSSQSHSQTMTEWQEGLKALLPNVNVRFASDMEPTPAASSLQQQSSHRWPSSSQQSAFSSLPSSHSTHSAHSNNNPHSLSHHQIMGHIIPPPPGFSVPN